MDTDSHGTKADQHEGIRKRRRCIWTACAVVSILSSRYLLVDLNLHFPLHLHMLHLATAAVLAVISYLRRPSSSLSPRSERQLGWLSIGFMFLAVLTALSVVVTMQAILHFPNISTLIMLSTTSFAIEAWSALVTGSNGRVTSTVLRASVLTLSCAGILLAEYRLLVSGLFASLPALLLSGIARTLRTMIADVVLHAECEPRIMNLIFCLGGFVVAGVWSLSSADESPFLAGLQLRYVPLLALNALSTAVALFLGQSVLIPMDEVTSDMRMGRDYNVGNGLTLLIMAGLVGLWSTLLLRRSYTAWVQVCCFFLAVVCIDCEPPTVPWMSSVDYKMLPNSSGPNSEDSATTVPSAPSDSSCVSEDHVSHRALLHRCLLITLTLAVWTVYLLFNFSEHTYQISTKPNPSFDLEYSPALATEVVVSMHKEPIEDVANLLITLKNMPNFSTAQFRIYVKDSNISTEEIQYRTGANNVTALPNIGRESETYLNHIINHWDRLAAHTVFLQAEVHNPREFYPRIRDYFDPPRTGFLSLGWSGQVCNCEECGDRWSFWDTTHLFPKTHKLISNSTTCSKVLSYKGQFIASAKRIRGVDISVYHDLREAFVNKGSWAHQEDYLQGRRDSMSQPVFGYTMERMWNLLLQCNDMDVAWRCPTLLSRGRIGGSIEDCQCLDPVS